MRSGGPDGLVDDVDAASMTPARVSCGRERPSPSDSVLLRLQCQPEFSRFRRNRVMISAAVYKLCPNCASMPCTRSGKQPRLAAEGGDSVMARSAVYFHTRKRHARNTRGLAQYARRSCGGRSENPRCRPSVLRCCRQKPRLIQESQEVDRYAFPRLLLPALSN